MIFAGRYTKGDPIGLHEFLYPLAQAQDSVEIEADVEIGRHGSEIQFTNGTYCAKKASARNLRFASRSQFWRDWTVLKKMSKSMDNYVGLAEPAETMYGKILSIPDTLTYRYFEPRE